MNLRRIKGKSRCGMKKFIVYAAAILGSWLLMELAELWFGAEWIFGLLTAAWYGLFLLAWKRVNPGGAGLIVVSVVLLLNLGSIFFVQYTAIIICSFLMGLMLLSFYRSFRDVVVTSMGFVLCCIAGNVEMEPVITGWILFAVAGILALIGFRNQFLWLKRCFTIVFGLAALYLLMLSSGTNTYLIIFALILAVVGGAYKFSRQPLNMEP